MSARLNTVSENMSYRMPDRMTTASVLERMSERVPEGKVVSSRMSGDCSKQSHAINLKLKREGFRYAVRIEPRPGIDGLVHAWLASQASPSESSVLLE